MAEYIIDTNVPLVAEGSSDMSTDCSLTCANFLDEVINNKHVITIDDDYCIITEYQKKMPAGSKSDYGNRFLKWILTNQANTQRVRQARVTSIDEYNFEEVPQSVLDAGFDKSDLKFVAVSIVNNSTEIVQASDSKWIGWEQILLQEGIKVKFLCKLELKEIHDKKIK